MEFMQSTLSKNTSTAKHGIHPSKPTLLRMFLATIGFIGMVVFGFLMESLLAPVRVASSSAANNGFNSFGSTLIIPAFVVSVYLFSYGAYELFKIYRNLNDPNNYGNKSRRTVS